MERGETGGMKGGKGGRGEGDKRQRIWVSLWVSQIFKHGDTRGRRLYILGEEEDAPLS